jgi:hypothetical protein
MQRLVFGVWLLFMLSACNPQEAAPVPTAAASGLLEYGGAIADTLPSGVSEKAWLFVAAEGERIQLELDGQADLRLAVAGEDEQTLASGRVITLVADRSGTLTATVSRQDTQEPVVYTLALARLPVITAAPAPTPTPTSTPEPTSTATPTPYYAALGTYLGQLSSLMQIVGTLQSVAERHIYTFEGAAGQYVTVRLEALTAGVDPAITLYDSYGEPLATDEDTGGSDAPLLQNIRLFADGVYALQVRADAEPGDYTLDFSLSFEELEPAIIYPQLPVTPDIASLFEQPIGENDYLAERQRAAGSLNRPGEFARFTIQPSEGDVVTIGVMPSVESLLDPLVEVYSPDGELLAVSERVGSVALVGALPINSDGIYSIFVLGQRETIGGFTIAYGLNGSYADVLRGPLMPEMPVQATASQPGIRDVWIIDLNGGDRIALSVSSATGEASPVVEITRADGTPIPPASSAASTGEVVTRDWVIPVSDLYLVRVTSSRTSGSGHYTLFWRYVTAAPTPTPLPAAVKVMTVDGVLAPGISREYAFQGQANQQLSIILESQPGSALDPVAALIAPDGSILREVDDSDGQLNPRFELVLPEDGTYLLRVSSYDGSGGAFMARVYRLIFASP